MMLIGDELAVRVYDSMTSGCRDQVTLQQVPQGSIESVGAMLLNTNTLSSLQHIIIAVDLPSPKKTAAKSMTQWLNLWADVGAFTHSA